MVARQPRRSFSGCRGQQARSLFFEPMYMYVGCEQQQVRGVKFWVVRYGDGGGGGGVEKA